MMTESMINAYLKRLDCSGATEPTEENLIQLHYAHLTHIPYETMDIFAGKGATPLTTEYLFEKIITQKRGGYCFELNGLFAELLRSLGYGVEEFFARWHFGASVSMPMRRHRVLRVTVGSSEFIADVGVGCICPLRPLEFKLGLVQPRNGRDYRIVRHPLFGYVVETFHEGAFVPFYSFTMDPQYPIDFMTVHYYCSNSQDSQFRTNVYVNLCTGEHGRLTLEDKRESDGTNHRVFSVTAEDGTVSTREVCSEEETSDILSHVYSIGSPLPQETTPVTVDTEKMKEIKNVTVYLSSCFPKDDVFRQAVIGLGKFLAVHGMTLVYGGSQEGLMGVLAKSVLDNGGRVIGVFTEQLPTEMAYPGLTKMIYACDLADRKRKMLELADAVIALPGSFGTWDELFDALSLKKIPLGSIKCPMGVLNVNDYYTPLIDFIRKSLDLGITPQSCANLLCSADTPEKLFAEFVKDL